MSITDGARGENVTNANWEKGIIAKGVREGGSTAGLTSEGRVQVGTVSGNQIWTAKGAGRERDFCRDKLSFEVKEQPRHGGVVGVEAEALMRAGGTTSKIRGMRSHQEKSLGKDVSRVAWLNARSIMVIFITC